MTRKTAPLPPPESLPSRIGPVIFSDGWLDGAHHLVVLVGLPEGVAAPDLTPHDPTPGSAVTPMPAGQLDSATHGAWAFWRYPFALSHAEAAYTLGQERFTVAADLTGDLRIGYVSCNGCEHGDFERPSDERNVMWDRLAEDHAGAPLHLLLQGGDQIYADAALDAHPDLVAWYAAPPKDRPAMAATPEARAALVDVFLDRWRRALSDPGSAAMAASAPTVAMWDDHDICDGWGSHEAPVQQSPIGKMLFTVARDFFRLFHAGGHAPAGNTFATDRTYPGLRLVVPDLRSERTKTRVIGPDGWAHLEQAMAAAGSGERVIVMSSVPALGPRLSLLEGLHKLIPGAQKYEDDLRDQWQSRAHRAEWRRFLKLLATHAEEVAPVTVVSGEIHLATRGEMALTGGGVLHQLTASGITHPPPPRGFARALGWLSMLGEAPLAEHPIRLRPLPGHRKVYIDERNYMVVAREGGTWSVTWSLEQSGQTAPLPLGDDAPLS